MRRIFPMLTGLALLTASAAAPAADEPMLSAMVERERSRLLEALDCPHETRNQLLRMKAGNGDGTGIATDSQMCELALEALCASSSGLTACTEIERTGAYAGYYLMRYTMPVVAMTRQAVLLLDETETSRADNEIADAGLESVFTILRLLSPGLRGCGNLPRVRTWCTVTEHGPRAVESHRAAIAYLASEGMRLFAECRARGAACPITGAPVDAALVRWFDVLLWDHALLHGTALRNSLTQHVRTPIPADVRLRDMRDEYDASAPHGPAFRFETDGWWMAVAANLLAVDALLQGDDDPRPSPLTESQWFALQALVAVGTEVLAQRAERTRIRNFAGGDAEGLQFDSRLWDRHEYRRFSGVHSGPRPFTVVVDSQADTPRIVFADVEERRARDVGLDSGHYRRLTWLHYTLSNVQRLLDTGWVDRSTLEGLANQFAYAVHWHDCHHTRAQSCDGAPSPVGDGVPRFVNYVSGQRGWYRLTPAQPCQAGVPPFGFSTLMTISENLWWAGYNEDVARIWGRLEAAVNDPNRPAPSAGDTSPCGDDAGTPHWHRTYRDTVIESDGRLSRHGLGFFAMKHWAELALELP